MEQVQQKAFYVWEGMEHQRCAFLCGSFKLLSASLNDSNTRLLEKIREFDEKSKNNSFEQLYFSFPEKEPIFFEHYKHKESVKSTLNSII